MGSKAHKAPEYAKATYNTGGLFGSSTSSKSGTTFNPTSMMKNIGNTAWGGVNNALNSLNSGDYSQDANYNVYANNLRNQMQQNYDTSVLSQLANRGLMRSSGLQSATNSFANTLANQTANLYDSYTNTLANRLNANQNTLNNLYNYITSVNTGSQNNANNVSNYNLSKAQIDNAAAAQNNAMYQTLANNAASIAL